MFITLKKKIAKRKIKKLLNKDWVKTFLNKRIKRYFPKARKIDDLEVEILRNFLGKFRNLTVRYRLILDFKRYRKKENILAKINSQTSMPKRWFKVAVLLRRKGFKDIPDFLDYLPAFNTVLYKEVKGEVLQDLLMQKKMIKILKIIPQLAKILKRFHSLRIKNFYLTKDKKEENREHRHWFFLIRKCAPLFAKRFRKIYYLLINYKEKNKSIFLKKREYILTHGDFHFGNLILSGKKMKIIDFSETDIYDPLNDVASFLAQTDSMARYYLTRKFLPFQRKVEKIFLRNYFGREINKEEIVRITFFKIRNFLQMAAILSFVTWPLKDKILAVKKSLNLAERELRSLISTNNPQISRINF